MVVAKASAADALRAGLQARRAEIEQTILARVYSISDPAAVGDLSYVAGLADAVSAAVAYGIAAMDNEEARHPPVPAELLAQARNAARGGVALDTVLRRYLGGHTLLNDFIYQEAEALRVVNGSLQEALRAVAATFEHLVAVATQEYRGEAELIARLPHEHRLERVRRLLCGELADLGGLDYDLSGWNVGAVASGAGVERTLRELAGVTHHRLLVLRTGEGGSWAWLGSSREPRLGEIRAALTRKLPDSAILALGERGRGLEGWRLTHRQAIAAFSVAERAKDPLVRYADVALLASSLQDDLLSTSLKRLYLDPLSAGTGRGVTLRRTLNAYFCAQRNITSTAATLGVTRKTVTAHLRAVEQCLEGPIALCAAELELALRLEQLAEATPTA